VAFAVISGNIFKEMCVSSLGGVWQEPPAAEIDFGALGYKSAFDYKKIPRPAR